MTGSKRTLAGVDIGQARRRGFGQDAWGLLPIVAALALWAVVLAGVVAPLGDALARIDADREPSATPVACPVPAGALASAAGAPDAGTCR